MRMPRTFRTKREDTPPRVPVASNPPASRIERPLPGPVPEAPGNLQGIQQWRIQLAPGSTQVVACGAARWIALVIPLFYAYTSTAQGFNSSTLKIGATGDPFQLPLQVTLFVRHGYLFREFTVARGANIDTGNPLWDFNWITGTEPEGVVTVAGGILALP